MSKTPVECLHLLEHFIHVKCRSKEVTNNSGRRGCS